MTNIVQYVWCIFSIFCRDCVNYCSLLKIILSPMLHFENTYIFIYVFIFQLHWKKYLSWQVIEVIYTDWFKEILSVIWCDVKKLVKMNIFFTVKGSIMVGVLASLCIAVFVYDSDVLCLHWRRCVVVHSPHSSCSVLYSGSPAKPQLLSMTTPTPLLQYATNTELCQNLCLIWI